MMTTIIMTTIIIITIIMTTIIETTIIMGMITCLCMFVFLLPVLLHNGFLFFFV